MVIMHHGAALIQFEGTSIVHTLWSKPCSNGIESSGGAWVQFLILCDCTLHTQAL